MDRRDGPNGSLVEIAWQDWEGKVVDRCHRIPEVAGWWVVCHNCPRVTDWVRVGHRSDQAATLFPIATSWRSFVGCPRGTWVQSLYGDKRTSVVEPQCFSSRPFRSVLISICPQRVKLRNTQCEQMSSALTPRTDIGLVARKHCADRMLWDFDRADVLLALILLQRRL